jgi:hypothetical protein
MQCICQGRTRRCELLDPDPSPDRLAGANAALRCSKSPVAATVAPRGDIKNALPRTFPVTRGLGWLVVWA